MENNKFLVFVGSFLFGFSIIVIILAMFFVKELDSSIKYDYIEVFLGWIGATIIASGIALKNYMNTSGGMGYSSESAGDSAVSFTTGLSFALYALLATWLWIINVPYLVLLLCLSSSALSFIGLIMVSYFSTASNA